MPFKKLKKNKSNQSAFTLIELLVVISIIGILSSVVLASLTTAKYKAKDAAIQSTLAQMELLLQQEYADTGSYSGLQLHTGNPWVYKGGVTCTDRFAFSSSAYKTEMIKLCDYVVGQSVVPNLDPAMYFGVSSNYEQRYTIAARKASDITKGWCFGYSGKSVDDYGGAWENTGCWADPNNNI